MVPPNSHLARVAAEGLQTSQPSSFARRAKLSQACSSVIFAMWNVILLLESKDSVETACQTTEAQLPEDKKINLVMRELNRYGVKITALQETKWFGCDAYSMEDAVVLDTGQPLPQEERHCISWSVASEV